jgi:hypothetical protein
VPTADCKGYTKQIAYCGSPGIIPAASYQVEHPYQSIQLSDAGLLDGNSAAACKNHLVSRNMHEISRRNDFM